MDTLSESLDALAVSHGLQTKPLLALPMRQAWRADTEDAFQPGLARLYLQSGSLIVTAAMRDLCIGNTAVRLNEHTWRLGDVFEVFLQTYPDIYYEFHVTPENQKLQLGWTTESFANVGREPSRLEKACIADPDFIRTETLVSAEANIWQAYMEIPLAHVGLDGDAAGAEVKLAFTRYDYTAGSEEPVLSGTPDFARLGFHLREYWHTLPWPPVAAEAACV